MLADPIFSLADCKSGTDRRLHRLCGIHDRLLRLGRLPGSYEIAAAQQHARCNAAGQFAGRLPWPTI